MLSTYAFASNILSVFKELLQNPENSPNRQRSRKTSDLTGEKS